MDEMTIERWHDPEGVATETFEVSGPVTIQQAAELREALLQSLESCDSVDVDLSKVTELDLSAVQILSAARRSAEGLGKWLGICKGSWLLDQVLRQAGFDCSTFPERGRSRAGGYLCEKQACDRQTGLERGPR